MRQTKFKGFTKDLVNNMWIEGDLIHYDKDDYSILPQYCRYWDISHDGNRVEKESIVQFTGLKDKNGKEIYEKDILELSEGDRFYVSWNRMNSRFVLKNSYDKVIDLAIWDMPGAKVIGNIFENKHLLIG